jgi:site-specific DNA-methyltransferase (adenine-specific)
MLAFGGTRTHHRLACAIEDAGWEIRDCVMWIYGSGFPKSLDVSKAIDREAGAKREVIGIEDWPDIKRNVQQDRARGINHGQPKYSPGTEKPRIGYERTIAASDPAKQWQGWGTALKPAFEPIILARKPLQGTVAQNVQRWGTGVLNIDACRIGIDRRDNIHAKNPHTHDQGKHGSGWFSTGGSGSNYKVTGRWPSNLIHDGSEEVLAGFPQTANAKQSWRGTRPHYHGNIMQDLNPRGHDDSGGSASRFFYTAKASRSDRDGSTHPTVKPTDLMQYLCRFVTPPGGLVLDPFAGSGSTGKAAVKEGFRFIGMDLEAEYLAIAKRRIYGPLFAETINA